MNRERLGRFSVVAGRLALTLALLALVSAWITEVTGSPLLGMSQQHLFNDAIVLALLGIASFLDALLHAKKF